MDTAAVITAICDWDGRKVAEIMLAGGSGVIESLDSELPAIEHWARDNGAVEIYARGRRGWTSPAWQWPGPDRRADGIRTRAGKVRTSEFYFIIR